MCKFTYKSPLNNLLKTEFIMKKMLIVTLFSGLLLGSCRTSQLASYTDDVYANPREEKELARLAAEQKAKKDAEEKQKREEELAAQKAKEDANPYYKDPNYNSDDYYDYEYSSRINRFYRPIGVGYYDNYYTNSYFYNQNPAYWGTSIYYNYGMPSAQFNNYSWAISTGWGYNNSCGYNNYWNGCYSNYYCPYYGNSCWDPWYSGCGYNYSGCSNNYWGYNNGYYNGYYSGYNNGYYSGWANANYFNRYDVNSGYGKMEYGPRGSSSGGNNYRRTTAGMEIPEESKGRREYVQQVNEQQNNTPRFTESRRKVYDNSMPTYNIEQKTTGNSSLNTNSGSQGSTRRRISENGDSGSSTTNNGSSSGSNNNSGWNTSPSNSNSGTSSTEGRRRVYEDRSNNTSNRSENRPNNDGGIWNNSGGGGWNNSSNNSGSSSPRSSGSSGNSGGGGRRP
jgi:hypothetical protein